jgi:hypothetical protein
VVRSNCTCHQITVRSQKHSRRELYTELLTAELEKEKGKTVGQKLSDSQVWQHWFGFSAARSFHSFWHRFEAVVGDCFDEISTEREFLRTVAETLVVGLDIDRVEVEGNLSPGFFGPRLAVLDDQGLRFDAAFGQLYECTGTQPFKQVRIFGRYEICEHCLEEIDKFLIYVKESWVRGSIKLGHILQEECAYFPHKVESSYLSELSWDSIPEDLKQFPLMQLGMAEALKAHYNSVFDQIRQAALHLNGTSGLELFKLFFEHSESDRGILYPWAFNVIFQKSEPKNGEPPGYGYILTKEQIVDIYNLAKRARPYEHEIGFWKAYDHLDQNNLEVNRTVEAVWQMQHYDGFVSDPNSGLIRLPHECGLPVCSLLKEYSLLVGESPIRKIEDLLIHKPWIMEVPIYDRKTTSFDPQKSFRGIAWLMSNHSLPPLLRLVYLDVIRKNENPLVNWIALFRVEATKIKESIEHRERMMLSWVTSHNEMYKREHVNEALIGTNQIISKMESVRQLLSKSKEVSSEKVKRSFTKLDDELSKVLKLTRVSLISNLQLLKWRMKLFEKKNGDAVQNELKEAIENLYRRANRWSFNNPVAIVDFQDNALRTILSEEKTSLREYFKEAVLCLAQNSVQHSTADKAVEPPFRFKVSLVLRRFEDKKVLVLGTEDTAGGLTDEVIEEMNNMLSDYLDGWKRGIRLSIDETRWVYRIRALMRLRMSTQPTGQTGLFSLIVDHPEVLDIRVSRASLGGFVGLKFEIEIQV